MGNYTLNEPLFCLIGLVCLYLALFQKYISCDLDQKSQEVLLPSGADALIALCDSFLPWTSLSKPPAATHIFSWFSLPDRMSGPPIPSLPPHPGSGLAFVHCTKMSS